MLSSYPISNLTRLALLLALTLAIQAFACGGNGPLVNFMLILTTIWWGRWEGFCRFDHALDRPVGRYLAAPLAGGAFHYGGECRLLPHIRSFNEN